MRDLRDLREYKVSLREESGASHCDYFYIPAGDESEQDAAAQLQAARLTREWVREGSYDGDEGRVVNAYFRLEDDDSEWSEQRLEVEIPPNHENLIRAVMGGEGCGAAPDDHDWTAAGEGGNAENPGVWGLGGTALEFNSHCAVCGLRRREVHLGSQRNPGDCDTTEYARPAAPVV